jgi:hypothetical protein
MWIKISKKEDTKNCFDRFAKILASHPDYRGKKTLGIAYLVHSAESFLEISRSLW